MEERFDTIIIGAGPAGLTACLYALRSRLRTLLIDKMMPGGYLHYIHHLENYPGFPQGIGGPQLASAMVEQLQQYEYRFHQSEVTGLVPITGGWRVEGDASWMGASVIIASGSNPRKLGVPGEAAFSGRGVSYCGVCDAPFFRNRHVVCIGGGNTALEESLYLTRFARKVTLVHRRTEFRAARIAQEKIAAHDRITCRLGAVCTEIKGDTAVRGVVLRSSDGSTEEIACDGVFIFIGLTPNTGFVPDSVARDEFGCLKTTERLSTTMHGLFACGDCRDVPLRQVVTACGEGAVAACSVTHYLEQGSMGEA